MKFHEHRKSKRFAGKIPVLLGQGTGLTRDYSVDGVYFVTDLKMRLGEKVELLLLLEHQEYSRGMGLRCRGDVVRVERGAGVTGVAVAISKHLLELAPEMAETYIDIVMS